jgi:uncharacterized protein YlbG (UPF0298 family)
MAHITERIDSTTNNLTVKFTKEIQVSFYAEMDQSFANLNDIEERMRDISQNNMY